MNDLHNEFAAWIVDGSRDELPRDVALHASGCSGCLQIAAAVDALAKVDPGEADMPPVRIAVGAGRSGLTVRAARAALGATAVALTIAAGFIVGGGLFDRVPDAVSEAAVGTPGGAVLGGQGGPAETPAAPPSPGSSEPSPVATATPVARPSPNPLMGGGPPPMITATPVPTPVPTAAPRATPAPTPAPTPTPTATPSPTPTPTATPTPTPETAQCSDGIDNDGDLLVDWPDDLGCSGPDDDDETGP